MFTKTMMTAAFALATIGAPAFAQMTGSAGGGTTGGMQSGTMPGGSTPDGSMQQGGMMPGGAMADGTMAPTATAPKMTRAQMASMKKCQAMPSAKMMKNKTCMKMQKMHPDMTGTSM